MWEFFVKSNACWHCGWDVLVGEKSVDILVGMCLGSVILGEFLVIFGDFGFVIWIQIKSSLFFVFVSFCFLVGFSRLFLSVWSWKFSVRNFGFLGFFWRSKVGNKELSFWNVAEFDRVFLRNLVFFVEKDWRKKRFVILKKNVDTLFFICLVLLLLWVIVCYCCHIWKSLVFYFFFLGLSSM